MKRYFLSIIFSLLFQTTALAGFFYTDEISTTYLISNGLEQEGKIYFVMSCKRYRRAKGIMAFPDGGQPKVVSDVMGVYRLNSGNNGFNLLFEISGKNKNRTGIPGTKTLVEGDYLYLSYRCSYKKYSQCIYKYNIKTGEHHLLLEEEGVKLENTIYKNYWNLYRDKRTLISKIKKLLKIDNETYRHLPCPTVQAE